MSVQDYVNACWDKHECASAELMADFKQHLDHCESQADVLALGNLIFHVSGEHLGQWSEGVALLEELKRSPHLKDEAALNRCVAALKICQDRNYSLVGFGQSDQARILAISASALASQNDLERAGKYLKKAQIIAEEKLSETDPAIKSLAITGNNLACALEEKAEQGQLQKDLMIQAALLARTYWEKAGTWLHVERAEYRLANTYLKAQDPTEAKKHAVNCLATIKANADDPLEFFYAYEALALCARALGDQLEVESCIHQMEQCHERVGPGDRSWTTATLEKVKAL